MPAPVTLTEVAALAAQLPPTEQKQLADTILRHLASGAEPTPLRRRRSWREIRGSVAYPPLR